MSDQTLDLSNVVNVTIVPVLAGLAEPDINTAALLSTESPVTGWSEDQAYKIYTNPSDVGDDFGTSSKAFKLATAFFGQQPNVLTTNGYLVVILREGNTAAVAATKTIQDLVYTAKTAGVAGNSITIAYTTGATKGAEVVSVDGTDIEVQIANNSSIAAEIKEAIDGDEDASALVSVALVAGHETDTQAAVTATNLAGGSDAVATTEDCEDAIARTINSVYYFGILVDELLSGTPLANLSAYVQSIDKMLFYASSNHADFAPGGALDLFRSGSLSHCRGLSYTGAAAIDTQRFAAAYAGRALSVDFSGVGTAQTLHTKALSGIVPDESIDQTALTAAQTAGVDVYVSIASVPGLFTSGQNSFFDEVYNEFWFKFALQTAGFNYLRQNGKIPQTNKGIEGLKNVYRRVCAQAARNGFVGPGSWTSAAVFGNPADLIDGIAQVGFYVWAPKVEDQSQADREARKAPTVQIAIKAQGAVHKSNVIVNVNL